MENFILGMLYTIVLIVVTGMMGVWWVSHENAKTLEPSKNGKSKGMTKKEKEKFLEEWKFIPPTVNTKPDHDGGFVDSYNMEWLLRDETGKEWVEYHSNISLSDFEVIYGNNVHEIIMIEMRLMCHV